MSVRTHTRSTARRQPTVFVTGSRPKHSQHSVLHASGSTAARLDHLYKRRGQLVKSARPGDMEAAERLTVEIEGIYSIGIGQYAMSMVPPRA